MGRPRRQPLDAAITAYAALTPMERNNFRASVEMAERLNAPEKPAPKRERDRRIAISGTENHPAIFKEGGRLLAGKNMIEDRGVPGRTDGKEAG
mgnify:CR=1 FL=1